MLRRSSAFICAGCSGISHRLCVQRELGQLVHRIARWLSKSEAPSYRIRLIRVIYETRNPSLKGFQNELKRFNIWKLEKVIIFRLFLEGKLEFDGVKFRLFPLLSRSRNKVLLKRRNLTHWVIRYLNPHPKRPAAISLVLVLVCGMSMNIKFIDGQH